MSYCYSPWTNLDISPQGQISPCCKFRYQDYKSKVPNINDISLDEYLASDVLYQIKEDFKNGKWPVGCIRCKNEEENNIDSKRILDYERWKEHYQQYKEEKGFITASIAFGNTCNLTCVTCSPEASSKWYQEYLKLYKIDIKPNHFYRYSFVENFLQHAPNVIHLDIPGGEPLLSGVSQQKELLQQLISLDKSKDITLHYTTNTTLFPDNHWLELWSHFKSVEIQLSIDGVDKRFEYIRYPANWEVCLHNIKKYVELKEQVKNMVLTVSTTVSAYNIAYLPELAIFLDDIGLGVPYYGKVHFPKFMRPTVWRNDAKDFIIERLDKSVHNYSNYINLLRTEDDQDHFQDFRYRLLRQDNYRKNSFGQTFPEMLHFLLN